jgi:branched-chain amino acid transport system permease protein
MTLLVAALITGIGLGSMYGLIALGFHVTYVISNTVNFSQGSAVMLGAVLGYTFAVTFGWPVFLAVAMALALCALFGLIVERTLVRPFADRGSNAWLMATVAASCSTMPCCSRSARNRAGSRRYWRTSRWRFSGPASTRCSW